MAKKPRRFGRTVAGAAGGAVSGAAVGVKVAPFVLPIDPTGILSAAVIGGFTVVGAVGGAFGMGKPGNGGGN
ncbi:MAG TPA: hypothetical protein VG889_09290 [Rhizomicrobium sp.]|nr:hypothetical protein [Rhizomicrobium sp.]